jgi:hypothetical protein
VALNSGSVVHPTWVVLPYRGPCARREDIAAEIPGESVKTPNMPRYVVERDFPESLNIPQDESGDTLVNKVIYNNAEDGVTWIHSYVAPDRKRTFCVYDGPNPEAIRRTATRNKLPVTKITEVRVLTPYAYR